MKKIYNSLLLAMVAVLPMLTSCSDDHDSNPTANAPTEFKINASPLAEQYIQLVEIARSKGDWAGIILMHLMFRVHRL